MYVAEIRVCGNGFSDHHKSCFERFLQSLHQTGYIVNSHYNLYQADDRIGCQCMMPTRNSLINIAGLAQRCDEGRELLSADYHIEVDCLGQKMTNEEVFDVCECKGLNSLILLGSRNIPLFCGDCGGTITLHSLLETSESNLTGYNDLIYRMICWSKINIAWTTLELHSHHEKLAQMQLGDITSPSNMYGLKIRQRIEDKTSIPCYYFIEELRAPRRLQEVFERACPLCDQHWFIEEPYLGIYHYKCEKCRLISDIPPDVRDEVVELLSTKATL